MHQVGLCWEYLQKTTDMLTTEFISKNFVGRGVGILEAK